MRDDEGATAIIVAVLLVVFIGFTALVVDVGWAYAVKRQHSVTADAAALAGAQAAALEYKSLYPGVGPGCTTDTRSAVSSQAAAAASDAYDDNDVEGSNPSVTTEVNCDSGNFTVTVTTSSELDAVFGPVLGVNTLNPGARATAIVEGSPAYGGLRPFAICIFDFPGTSALSTTTYQTVYPKNKNDLVACGTASGQWGLVDFNGQSNGTPSTREWILYGYPGPISFPTDLYGDPGASFGALTDELNTLVNATGNPANDVVILLPVADGWTGRTNGQLAEMSMPGVLSAKLCGYGLDPTKDPVKVDPTCWDPALYGKANPGSKFVLQWRYEEYVASYQYDGGSGTGCSLTDKDCVPAIRLWRNP